MGRGSQLLIIIINVNIFTAIQLFTCCLSGFPQRCIVPNFLTDRTNIYVDGNVCLIFSKCGFIVGKFVT